MTKNQILAVIERTRQAYEADSKKHFEAAFKEAPDSRAFKSEFTKHIEAAAAERALSQLWFDICNLI